MVKSYDPNCVKCRYSRPGAPDHRSHVDNPHPEWPAEANPVVRSCEDGEEWTPRRDPSYPAPIYGPHLTYRQEAHLARHDKPGPR